MGQGTHTPPPGVALALAAWLLFQLPCRDKVLYCSYSKRFIVSVYSHSYGTYLINNIFTSLGWSFLCDLENLVVLQ